MKKFFVFLFLLFLVVAVGSFLATRRLQQSSSPSVPTEQQALPPPRDLPFVPVPSVPTANTGTVVFSFSFPPVPFPGSLPTYTIGSSSIDSASIFASALGFSSAPTRISGVKTVLLWNLPSSSFVAQSPPLSFSYSQTLVASGALPSFHEADNVIRVFSQKFSSLASPYSLSLSQSGYYKEQGTNFEQTDVANAQTIHLFYTLLLNGKRVLFDKSTSSFISAVVGANKTIVSVAMISPPVLSVPQTTTVFPLSLAQEALVQGRGVLVNVIGGDSQEEVPITPSFSTVTITSVEIAYLEDSSKNLLSPVFLFSGEAQNNDTNTKNIRVEYLVTATPDK